MKDLIICDAWQSNEIFFQVLFEKYLGFRISGNVKSMERLGLSVNTNK